MRNHGIELLKTWKMLILSISTGTSLCRAKLVAHNVGPVTLLLKAHVLLHSYTSYFFFFFIMDRLQEVAQQTSLTTLLSLHLVSFAFNLTYIALSARNAAGHVTQSRQPMLYFQYKQTRSPVKKDTLNKSIYDFRCYHFLEPSRTTLHTTSLSSSLVTGLSISTTPMLRSKRYATC